MTPHRLFIFLAVATVACEMLVSLAFGNRAFDIPLHDTYFVIATLHIAVLIAMLLLFIATIYQIGKKYHFHYNIWLTLGHFITTVLWICYFLKLIPLKYYDFDNNAKKPYESMNYASKLLIIIMFLSLLFFLFNLLAGFIKRKKSY